jgi:hypothetical protein
MQRRKLVATAGALSVTAFAATVAIGANFGLVGQAEPRSPVGRLDDHHQVVAASATAVNPATAAVVTTPKLGPNADD